MTRTIPFQYNPHFQERCVDYSYKAKVQLRCVEKGESSGLGADRTDSSFIDTQLANEANECIVHQIMCG